MVKKLKSIGALLALCLLFLVFSASAASAQAACPLCDELTQTVDEALDPVEEALNDPVGTVEETVEDPVGTLTEIVEHETTTVKNFAASATDGLNELVNDAPADVGEIEPAGGPAETDGPKTTGPAERPTRTLSGARPDRGQFPGSAPSIGRIPDGPGVTPQTTTFAPEPDALERFSQSVGDATAQLAFPLALLVMMAAFLVLQGRFDGKDPKLAFAPIDSEQEFLSFQ